MTRNYKFNRDDPHLAIKLLEINVSRRDIENILAFPGGARYYAPPDFFGDDAWIEIEKTADSSTALGMTK